MAGALQGLRVIDASAVIAGPFAATLLADFGADVIKVEMPGTGDTGRGFAPQQQGLSLRWPTYGRNKKSLSLDLRKPEGKEIFLKLVAKSDLIIENFRTGTFDKWGFDYETLKKANPNIIVVRVTGFGQTGPLSHLAGFGTPCTAFSGYTYISGHKEMSPVSPAISLADYVAGLYAAFGAMLCLYNRDHHGGGQEVDVSLYEGLFRMLEGIIANYSLNGEIQERSPGIGDAVCPAGSYQSKDGKWLVLVCSTDKTFYYLADAMDRPELKSDPKFITNAARVQNRTELEAIIVEWLSRHDWKDIKEILDKAGAPVSLIYTIEDCFNDAHYKARESLVEIIDPRFGKMHMPGITPKLSRTPGEIKWTGPDIGQHNEDLLTGILGISKDEIAALKEKGVL
ncbi:CoA transferase [Desulfovibrio sp. OttesenSCG-928-O18]|nr:CoA transferase [Desulfovibrio sp. OttesenSCG-928-O18]